MEFKFNIGDNVCFYTARNKKISCVIEKRRTLDYNGNPFNRYCIQQKDLFHLNCYWVREEEIMIDEDEMR